MKKIVTKFYGALIFLAIVSPAFSQIRLPAVLGSHMVLQQNTMVNFWGWCDPAEKITITTNWDTTTYFAVGSSGATWMTKIKTPAAGGPYKIILQGYNKVELDDILIGEVWLCGGQSNMQANGMPGGLEIKQSVEEAPHATNTSIRFFFIPKSTSAFLQDDVAAHWVVCSPEEMKKFSSVGYFFGKELQQKLNVPVGLISSNWGGTPAETWTPKETIDNDAILANAAQKLEKTDWWPVTSGAAYNSMIYPVTHFAIAGAIWYQGESNTETNSTYSTLLNTMIGSWRKAWQNEFPFYLVQIAPFTYDKQNIRSLLCEQQTKTLSFPKTGMVVISDLVDDVKNIHPQNKKEVGLRLAHLALAKTYNKKEGAFEYPLYKTFAVEKNKIRINFANVTDGLISKNGDPKEFWIAGDDKKFVPAKAKIDKNTILVWSHEVKKPVAVRFGFGNASMPNVFSKEGLPVNLFRTDDWDVDTSAVTN
jgi:sialate O-acetylesterase